MNSTELMKGLKECFENMSNKGYLKQFFVTRGYFSDMVFVTFEALETKDYPNGIAENGKYVRFEINEDTIIFAGSGHIWLSKEDMNNEKYKYYAMRGMWGIAQEKGVKKFRKTKFKDAVTAFDKMNTYFQNVMREVDIYSTGYPYDNGMYSKR